MMHRMIFNKILPSDHWQQTYSSRLGIQFRALLVITVLFVMTSGKLAAETKLDYSAASTVVTALHEKLLYAMMHADDLKYQGRYDEIKDIITTSFDSPLIAKVIMSRYWRKMDDQQKANFMNLFKRLSVATYASRFDGYSGESFVELSSEMLKKGRLLIKTELQRPHDDPVRLDYLMHQKEGQWLIISVIANGVNDLSLKRAEYATVIKEKGFEGLVEDVARKISNMENQKEI